MAVVLTRKQGVATFPKTFISLLDTPATYAGSTSEYLRSTGSALEFTAISGAGTTDHAALSNLDYEDSGHTGFASTVHIHDDRYYTESETDSMLITTFSGLSDTPSLYEDGKYLRSTASGTEWATISGAGVADHSDLTHLDYASSGHTGFASTANLATTSGDLQSRIDDKSPTGHAHDDRYYTESEVDTISGYLQTSINDKDNYQSWSFAVDGAAKDVITSGDILDFVGGNNITITRSADDEITISGSEGVTDHNALSSLDYASSGHTGFAQSSHTHTESDITDLDKYTQTEVDTISGSLNDKIDALDYYTTGEVDTISGTLQAQIDGKSDTDHLHDDRYYTETETNTISGSLNDKINALDYYTTSEVDTISGALSAEIDADITIHEVGSSHDSRYYTEAESDANWITQSGTIDHNTILNTHNLTTNIDHNQLTNYTINEHRTINDSGLSATDLWSAQKISDEIASASGTTDHAALDNLDYTLSGHTGFASTADLTTTSGSLQTNIDGKSDVAHIHDDRYYTETETDTISGTLQTQIDGKDNYQSWSFAVDGVTKDAITSGDILDFVGGDNITITRTADDRITISGAAGGEGVDHGSLTGLTDDDHIQYILTNGTRGFSATVSGVTPTENYHLATKGYVDTVSGSLQTNIDGKSDVGHDHDGAGGWMIKNSDYVANISDKIMLDSSGGPFAITLPSNPSLSDSVAFLDMTGTCGTNNVTVTVSGGGCEEYVTPSGNAVDFSPSGGYTPPTASGADFTFCIDGGGGAGEKIMGLDENLIINIDNSAFELVYSTAVWGWRIF